MQSQPNSNKKKWTKPSVKGQLAIKGTLGVGIIGGDGIALAS